MVDGRIEYRRRTDTLIVSFFVYRLLTDIRIC